MKPQTMSLIKALNKRAMTTKELRDQLGISSVAAVVMNAREHGCGIMTELIQHRNRHNEKVNVAKYFLCNIPARVATECGIQSTAARRKKTTRRSTRKAA